MARRFSTSCELKAAPDEVWSSIGSMDGVNFELSAWMRMSVPRALRGFRIEQAPLGQTAFASWLLALGIFPFDRHALRLASVEPGRAFAEDSSSWTERRWEHRRTLEPLPGGGCRLTDQLAFEPRLLVPGALVEWIVRRLFAHRHRRLRARFGSP